MFALFEISSTVAELVCERDKADQVADRMDEVDGAIVKRLTSPQLSQGVSDWRAGLTQAATQPVLQVAWWPPCSEGLLCSLIPNRTFSMNAISVRNRNCLSEGARRLRRDPACALLFAICRSS
jgi:hypothetical protein